MVRLDVVRRRLDVLLDALSDLRRYRDSVGLRELEDNRDTQHMVLHAMYVAAQATIDLALHAAADLGEPLAITYRDAFPRLAEAGRIPPELASQLQGWAGLRNVLAHHYVTIDYRLVHESLTRDLGQLERFAAIVSDWLEGAAS